MKKIKLFIVLAFLIAGISLVEGTGLYGVPDASDLKVSLISQDPDPVNPGEYVDMRWKVINEGAKDAEDVVFEILPSYPFSLDPGENAVQDIGNVWGLQSGEKGIILYYKLRVDKAAVEGENEIKLKAHTKGNVSQTFNFTIKVQTVDAALAIYSAVTDSDRIVPGEKSKIKITLKNLADSVMKDITIKLDLSSDALPFAPIGDSTEKRIKYLEAGKEGEVEFNIITLADADSQTYKIPINLTYYDELGEKYSKSDLIGIIVGSTPDLIVQLDSSTISKEKSTGDVSIKIVNKGLNGVKFLTTTLGLSEDYDVLSPEEVYVGSVDSDDYETADFKLYVKNADDNKVIIPVTVKYMDSINNKYSEKYELILNLDSVAKMSGKSSGLMNKIIFVLILAGAGYYYYKHKKKKRK